MVSGLVGFSSEDGFACQDLAAFSFQNAVLTGSLTASASRPFKTRHRNVQIALHKRLAKQH
jgi:hypothetical protein